MSPSTIAFFPHSQLLLWVWGRRGLSTHLQWTRNYMALPEHGPCVLRRLCVASTQSLWVTSPALQGLAGLFVRGLGGLAVAESVKHLPMEKQMPTPASFLQTGKSRGGLLSALLGCTVGTAQGAPGRIRCRPSGSWQMPSVIPFIFLNQILSMAAARSVLHLFFFFFFPRGGHCAHNCTLLFWDLSPEKGLGKLDFHLGVSF